MNPNFGKDAPDEVQIDEDEVEETNERKPLTPNRPSFSTYNYGADDGEGEEDEDAVPRAKSVNRWRATTGEPTEGAQPPAPTKDELRREAALRMAEAAAAPDPRKSRQAQVLIVLLMVAPGIDLLVFLPQPDSSGVGVEEMERDLSWWGRTLATMTTVLIGLWLQFIARRWQRAQPKHVQMASAMFTLTPEFLAIAVVLDVGKLAYPASATLSLVLLLMLIRGVCIGLTLYIALQSGTKRGLIGKKGMPEMLRTLISLPPSGEDASFGSIKVDQGAPPRPLSVALLEQLIVFLAPRKRGLVREGAGLARGALLPMLVLMLLVAIGSAGADFRRIRSLQEPLLSELVAADIVNAQRLENNSAYTVSFDPHGLSPPPVSVYVVVLSGLTKEVSDKYLLAAFEPATNGLCDVPFSSCTEYALRAELPTTSLPNWLALLTGASPATHGVLGNVAVPSTPLDSVARVAAAHGVHMGITASPFFVNPIKDELPLLDGDGRVSSSADSLYETTESDSTEAYDAARREAALGAAATARGSTPDAAQVAPSKYALFVSQFTDIDTQGHAFGVGAQYETATRAGVNFVRDLMQAVPENTVLLVLSDHGHEAGGGTGGGSAAVSRVPLFVYKKSVQFGAGETALAPFTGEGTPLGNTHGDAEISMIDLANTICLLRGLPVPRHSEGGVIGGLMAAVSSARWEDHMKDLFFQRWWYAHKFCEYEDLKCDGSEATIPALLTRRQYVQEAEAMGAVDSSYSNQANAWLVQANAVREVLVAARRASSARYALRNTLVTVALSAMMLLLVFYVLHTMTFADPWFVMTYRRHARVPGRLFHQLPDTHAMLWAAGVVGGYYLITLTVYAAIIDSSARHQDWSVSVVHNTFSQRRFFLATLTPGLIAQWMLRRSYTIFYKRPFPRPKRQASGVVKGMQRVAKLRMLLDTAVESSDIGRVYLIRLYVSAFAIVSVLIVLILGAPFSFVLPYMFQVKYINHTGWATRFQTLTVKVVSVPLLLGCLVSLLEWGQTRVNLREIDALFELKKAKDDRLLGEHVDEDVTTATQAEAVVASLQSAQRVGAVSQDVAEDLESLVVQTRAEKDLFATQVEALRVQIAEQLQQRADAIAALSSSRAFLSRGFRDIEMLLEAGFTELESKRTVFMGVGKKRAAQRIQKARANQAARIGKHASPLAQVAMDAQNAGRLLTGDGSPGGGGGGGGGGKKKRGGAWKSALAAADGGGGGGGGGGGPLAVGTGRRTMMLDEMSDEGEYHNPFAPPDGADSDDDDDLSSLASEDLQRMGYDELQARLAGNEQREKRMLAKMARETGEVVGGGGDGVGFASAAEAEAADVRREEFFSIAQSKRGKEVQIEELTAQVVKEQTTTAALRSQLEATVLEEQEILRKWQQLDEELQEAEVDKATFLGAKQKEKEVALEKAQVAEASLEELKEKFRELRRQEEKMIKAVEAAEAEGSGIVDELKREGAALQARKQAALEKRAAAESDRAALFAEAQGVEHQLRDERAKKLEASQAAAHYRQLLEKTL